MTLPALVPGEIVAYDPATKLARVSIPGLTDGDSFPEAEFLFPTGDKGQHTDIRILPGDRVWLAFRNGDPRYPIVMGFRNAEMGNAAGVRRFHHDNIETDADSQQKHTAGARYTVQVGQTVIVVQPGSVTITAAGSVSIDAVASIALTAPAVTIIASAGVHMDTPVLSVSGDIIDNA